MTHPTTAPDASGTPGSPAPGTGRSGRQPGDLYREVAHYLSTQPGVTLTVGEVTRAIGAPSTGAVTLALQKMAAAGHAVHETGPHRFTVTQAGVDAAGSIPSPQPRTAGAGGGGAVGGRSRKHPPIQRPNGALYFPRRLAGSTDVEVLRRLRAAKTPAMLYGPPGTGKTSLVEAAFNDVLTVSGTGDTTVEDFVGGWVPQPGGGYVFVYGPLVNAMRQGRVLFADDATLIQPQTLAALYPAMDGRGEVILTSHHNEFVTAVDGFYVVVGHNPGVHGAILTEALASRLAVHIKVTTDWDLALHLKVPRKAVEACVALNTRLETGEISWAPQLREALAFAKVAEILNPAAAAANLAALAPDHDRDTVVADLEKAFGTTIVPLALGKQH
jgi:MoxR-like ATPase